MIAIAEREGSITNLVSIGRQHERYHHTRLFIGDIGILMTMKNKPVKPKYKINYYSFSPSDHKYEIVSNDTVILSGESLPSRQHAYSAAKRALATLKRELK